MKILANNIKVGNVLVIKDELWIVAKNPEHTKPGKGKAYIQLELKNLKTGIKLYERFASSDYVEKAFLEQKKFQFLYIEGENIILMNKENFEQIAAPISLLGERRNLLADDMELVVEFHKDQPLAINLPQSVALEVIETAPSIKGATATSSYKPATLTGGVRVMVPPYITNGEKIAIKTEDLTFIERVKS